MCVFSMAEKTRFFLVSVFQLMITFYHICHFSTPPLRWTTAVSTADPGSQLGCPLGLLHVATVALASFRLGRALTAESVLREALLAPERLHVLFASLAPMPLRRQCRFARFGVDESVSHNMQVTQVPVVAPCFFFLIIFLYMDHNNNKLIASPLL